MRLEFRFIVPDDENPVRSKPVLQVREVKADHWGDVPGPWQTPQVEYVSRDYYLENTWREHRI